MIFARTHDGTGFVIYSGDGPSYSKLVLSAAEFDRMMESAIAFDLERGWIWTRRARETEEYQG